jgi:RNase P subunit RPR2
MTPDSYDDRNFIESVKAVCPRCHAVTWLTAPKPGRQTLPVTCLECGEAIP